MTTDTYHPREIDVTTFTPDEARALEALRLRYRDDHDLFSARQRAHLRFQRWLMRTGRLAAESTAGTNNTLGGP